MRVNLIVVGLASLTGVLTAQVPTYVTAVQRAIGGDSAGPPELVFNRLSDARRLSDGRIVAAVCGAKEVRSFDAAGHFLTTLSLVAANAPMRSLTRLFPAGGDSLAAFESLNVRLTMIAPDLSAARTVTVPHPAPAPAPRMPAINQLDVIGRFGDGTFVGRLAGSPSTDAGLHRRTVSYYRFDNAGKILDSLTGVPENEYFVVPGQRQGAIRLGRTTVSAVLPDRLVIGDQASAEITEYGMDLRPLGRFATTTKPVMVTDSVRSAWTAMAIARTNFPVNGITPVYNAEYADAIPAFRDLVMGGDGSIWIQDPIGADSYPLEWTAYRSGRAAARVELPPRFYPTQFGSDWVLGLAFDTTAVERVQLLHFIAGPLSEQHLSPHEAAPTNRPFCGAWTSR